MKNWKEVDGWFDEENESFFYDCVKKLSNPKVFYEVGSWKGRSTCCMGQILKSLNMDAKIYAVDTFCGSGEQIHINEISRLNSQNLSLIDVFNTNIKECEVDNIITAIPLASEDASKKVENESIDFLYLDASHDYNNVTNDLNCWLPKMKNGSIISGDDYVECWFPVIQAVNDFFEKYDKKVEVVKTQWKVIL